MRVQEIRDLSPEDITARISDTRRELVDLRFQLAARKLENTSKLREARKNLSRLLTIQSQKTSDGGATKTKSKKAAAPKAEGKATAKATAAKKPAAKKAAPTKKTAKAAE